MPGNMTELQKYAAMDIIPEEDDVGDDDDDDVAFAGGAKAAVAGTAKARATAVFSTGATIAQTGVSAVGNLARVGGAVGSALAPVVAITGPIGIAMSLIESGFSAASAVSTYRHIKQLERIIELKGPVAKPGTLEAIVFCCKKKNKKLKRKGLGCVPILGSICNTVYTVGRSIQKRIEGTRGVERRQQASILWQNTLIGDQCAIAACKEILGEKVYALIEGLADGHLVLKKKMKSL